MTAYETEYLGMAPAISEESIGVVVITVRLNRSKGSLIPIQLKLSRAQLERILEDGVCVLDHSEALNDPATIAESGKRVSPEDLPDLF